MKKNMYSLILSEEVINAIDRMACEKGTNRSALINRVLAEYVSYVTPEMRREEIFASVGVSLNGREVRLLKNTDSFLVLTSSLEYKYNPTVRYSIELYSGKESLGKFKATLRSQNPALLAAMDSFCLAWQQTEERMIGACDATTSGGRYERRFYLRASGGLCGMISAEMIGGMIADYINAYDRAMKRYFRLLATGMTAEANRMVYAIYKDYIASAKEII